MVVHLSKQKGKIITMIKKIFCALAISAVATVVTVTAAEIEFDSVKYLSSDGSQISYFPSAGEEVTASVFAENKTEGYKDVTILTAVYKDGLLSAIDYSTETVAPLATEDVSATVTIPSGANMDNAQVKSFVIDTMTGFNPYINPATMLADTTYLSDVYINGTRYDEFVNNKNAFKVMNNSSDLTQVTAIPVDSTSKVEIINPEKLPGNAKIKVTSQFGYEREIDLVIYREPMDLYSLTNLKYYIGDTEYSIEDFDSKVTSYEVELPDNTFYVRVEGETIAEKLTTQAHDFDFSAKDFDGVSYLPGANFPSYAGFTALRPALNGVVPIKNEQTNAVITASDGENSTAYTVTFKSKQPRLTEFNIASAVTDTYKPAFIGGAAVNNDNFTLAGTDRGWAYANISQNLVGGSMFIFDLAEHRGATSWFKTRTSGEYFNFTADTPGTIYFVSSLAITNPEFANDGWEKVTNFTPTKPAGITEWKKVNKTWNGYEPNCFFIQKYEWASAADKANPEKYEYFATQPTSSTMGAVMKKSFSAGENVSVYHLGKYDSHLMTAIIKWNIAE